jgi:hypothetical protein
MQAILRASCFDNSQDPGSTVRVFPDFVNQIVRAAVDLLNDTGTDPLSRKEKPEMPPAKPIPGKAPLSPTDHTLILIDFTAAANRSPNVFWTRAKTSPR